MSATDLTYKMQETLSMLARENAIYEAIQLFRKLKSIILPKLHQTEIDIASIERDLGQNMGVLKLTEQLGLGLINILINISEQLKTESKEHFENIVKNIDWNDKNSIYRINLPIHVKEKLEYLEKTLAFENKVEGQIITPRWYQLQIIAQGYCKYITITIETLIEELEGIFSEEVDKLLLEKKYIFGAQLIQRGLEATHKYPVHFKEYKKCFDLLSTYHTTKDLPWPKYNAANYYEQIHNVREKLIISLSNTIIHLLQLPKTDNLPDYFGQAYSVLTQECYSSMATQNVPRFNRIFPPIFGTCILLFDKLRSETRTDQLETRVDYTTEPISDICELSGYAILYSELYGVKYWEPVKKLWDNFFAQYSDTNPLYATINAVIDYRQEKLQRTPRDLLRTGWSQDFERRLRQLGLLSDYLMPSDMYFKTGRKKSHTSAIIRAVTRGMFMNNSPQVVFQVCYLLDRPERGTFKPNESSLTFVENLRKEREHDQSQKP